MDSLPFSQAADNNREPILRELRRLLTNARTVLEVGAGTGQHAVAFSSALPHLDWQPSEQPGMLELLRPRCAQASQGNLAEPIPLDIFSWPGDLPWPDALYTANTLHIVSMGAVEALFEACAVHGRRGTRLLIYGPFKYAEQYTSPSNAEFDKLLRHRDPASGIRDFEWVNDLATLAGYQLLDDVAMPANNRLLCWERLA